LGDAVNGPLTRRLSSASAEHQGTIEAANEKEAIEKAAEEFSSCAGNADGGAALKDFLRGRNDFVLRTGCRSDKRAEAKH
jgi:hypothetical protein